MLSALDRLRLFLRPPGRGVYTHSTGGGYAAELLRQLYGTDNEDTVEAAREDALQKIRRVEVIVFGLPSDTGAGILRGANFGPLGVRLAYLKQFNTYPKGVLDIGDVFCVPQLLHDEMLNEAQIRATHEAIYPGVKELLPVSPLSIARGVYQAIRELNPKARILLIGGDHSVSWPAVEDLHAQFDRDYGILHFDAHTDLLPVRLGVKYCFATWAYHAMQLMDPKRLVQVGIRTSGKTREYWAKKYPLKQFWADEILKDEVKATQDILEYLKAQKINHLYISNDIDGTDSAAAPATGTPESQGLTPQFVLNLIEEVGKQFNVIGADIVEVAPPLSGERDFAEEMTCQLAAEYFHASLHAVGVG